MSIMRPMGDRVADLEARGQRFQEHWSEGQDNPLLGFYVKIMTRVTGAERCSIFISDPSTGKVWLKCGTDLSERDIEVAQEGSIVGEVVSTGVPVRLDGLEERGGAHRSVDEATGFVTRNVLCVPIHTLDGERVAGAVQLLNKQGGRFTDEDQALLEEMAHFLELSIENIFYNQEMSTALGRAVRFATAAVFGMVAIGVIASALLFTYLVVYASIGG